MYRVGRLFRHLEYNLAMPLYVTTLARDFIYAFYVVHGAGSIFFFIARQEAPGWDGLATNPGTWVGQAGAPRFYLGMGPWDAYIRSVYWALVTFSTVGYGDLAPYTIPEVAWVIVYISFNVFFW